MRQKIVHIVGPTGVGKTALAEKLAKKIDSSLISADSIQVYKGLDIISGKDIPKGSNFKLIKKTSDKFDIGYYNFPESKIFLLDVVEPTYSFSVYDFIKVTYKVLSLLSNDKKIPIIVGGTGLYIEKLKKGLDHESVKPDYQLREKLNNLKIEELKIILKGLNPEKFKIMNNSDLNNPRRLIRAIEIESIKKQELRNINHEAKKREAGIYDDLVIGLKCDREVLKQRITKRVASRIKDGAFDEATKLFKNYKSLSPSVKNANGYKQLFSYLNKEINLEEAILRWGISEYRHAKNQMTWFKKYGKVKWFDIAKKDFEKDIDKEISNFLT